MISVCIAAYNGEKYIASQLASILPQLCEGDEVIVSDDGSGDKTLEIVRSYGDPRIILISNESGRHGVTGNSINALKAAKGDVIFPCDQDDVWLPGKVKKVLSALEGYDMVHHDSFVTDDDLNVIADSLYAIKHNGPGVIKNMKKGSFYGSHMAITRRLLDLCFPFPGNDEVGHDLWIGFVASMKCRCNYIPDKLIYYRRHEGVHCDLFSSGKRPLYKKLWGRIVMAFYLLKFSLSRI